MLRISRLNHAVLYVSDLERSIAFYTEVMGFDVIAREGPMAFFRAKGSSNHHDLGILGLGPQARRPGPGTVGLYHLAWEVPTIEDLAAAAQELQRAGALTGASDHGATKSLYGVDPDGNEFEIMWMVPRALWGEYEHRAVVRPLDLRRELERFGAASGP